VGADALPLFRRLLRRVATLQKRAGGALWVLRPEFAGGGDA
jgi:hypothetical protein